MVNHFSQCQFHEFKWSRDGKQLSWCWYGLAGCVHSYIHCPCQFVKIAQDADTLLERKAQFRPANERRIRGMP